MKKVETVAFVTMLVLAFLAGGTWAGARDTAGSTDAAEARLTEQPAGEDTATENANVPVARPHPRGLPRRRAGAQRRSRKPGPSMSGLSVGAVVGDGPRSPPMQEGVRT